MYIITWSNTPNGVCSVSTQDIRTLYYLTAMLDSNKCRYFVSDRDGKLKPNHFGLPESEFWLKPHETFN